MKKYIYLYIDICGKVNTSYELWVEIHELRVEIHELRVQIHELEQWKNELQD